MEKKTGRVYTQASMILKEDINAALDKMILSASGWRGVFSACGGEEGASDQISEIHSFFSGAAALVFAEYLQNSSTSVTILPKNTLIFVGSDTRPTGKAIAQAIIKVLIALGCEVRYAGFTAAPEIMAWARSTAVKSAQNEKAAEPDRLQVVRGFIYISASHNPIGHNGLKFGLADGGVLAAEEAAKLIANFRAFLEKDDCVSKIESLVSAACPVRLKNVYDGVEAAKTEALSAYYNFCGDVVWGGSSAIAAAIKDGLEKQPLGIVCDFNGSARTVSIDREFFAALGLKFECINGEPGQIVHRVVPEGESLEPCRALLEEAHSRDASFMLGYVPDCDGDRGNLVIWDDILKKARALEAQEVFALACAAEFSHLVWTGELSYNGEGKALSKAAVAVNDPTSMRIDRISGAFGVSVFRAEVGEANVVALARRLREEGFLVRILGEGSAGGNITHPSAVRDPINTVLAIVKLFSVRSAAGKSGLFEIWRRRSGQMEKYRENFSLADIIASLPQFASTPAYSQAAVLRINAQDYGLLKDRYQKIFLREWEERKDELKTLYGLHNWEAIAYNGLTEKRGLTRFGDAGRGGLKIIFLNGEGKACAYIWMRGSTTEPVFRIMADAEGLPDGTGGELERLLLDWQRRMIIKADTKE